MGDRSNVRLQRTGELFGFVAKIHHNPSFLCLNDAIAATFAGKRQDLREDSPTDANTAAHMLRAIVLPPMIAAL